MASVSGEAITASVEETSPVAAGSDAAPWVDGLPLYRLSVDQYRRMADHGVIDSKSRVHLINGLLVAKMTKAPPHIIATNNLDYYLNRRLPEGWHLSIRNPIQVPPSPSLPEPDVAVLRGLPSDYAGRIAGPADILFIVEVSDSSLRADQTAMKALYAQANIAEYWVVNLVDFRIEVYTGPTGPVASPGYRQSRSYDPGMTVPILADGRVIAQLDVEEILPPCPRP